MKTSVPKTILMTGASRGIGLLTAKTLAAKGHKVFATMRNVDTGNAAIAAELTELADAKHLDLSVLELDITSAEDCQRAVATIEAESAIDVVINNAGVMPVGLTEAYSMEALNACLEVNLHGPILLNQAVLPGMRQRRKGLLIHLSSSAGRLAIPYFGVYCASKWALEAYAESLHYELQLFNIESILVEPSGHATDLVTTAPAPDRQEVVQQYGDMADGREKLLGMFTELFAQQQAGNNAQNVADCVAALIESPVPRPLRTQVGDDMGVTAINRATAPIQAALIDQLSGVYRA